MASVNKVILVGNLGKEPEVRHTNGQDEKSKVASFTLATSRKFKGSDGSQKEETEWHNVNVWGKLATVIENYTHKGSSLYIEGRLKTRSYEKDGQKRYVTEIIAESIQLLDRKGDGPAAGGVPQKEAQVFPDKQPKYTPVQTPGLQQSFEDFAPQDDLPF